MLPSAQTNVFVHAEATEQRCSVRSTASMWSQHPVVEISIGNCQLSLNRDQLVDLCVKLADSIREEDIDRVLAK